jgi:hypothetical protein
MTTDPIILLTVTVAGLTALAMLVFAALAGWRGWLDLERQRLGTPAMAREAPPASARIELADLKERIRKLEAIAAGIDL